MTNERKPDEAAARGVAALAPRSDADLGLELHRRLKEALGETCDLLNDPRWRHLQAGFALNRDATGRWFVAGVMVNVPA